WGTVLCAAADGLLGQCPPQILARVDAELLVDVAQVVFDRLRAQKQGRCGLAGRLTCGEQQRDLELLRRQLVDGGRFAAAECLAAGLNLAVCSLCPRTRVEALKGLHGHPELLAGSHPVPRSAQTLAVGQSRARGLERVRRSGVLTERVVEMR